MYHISPMYALPWRALFFFFNDTATTEIYTLSLHDALPILLHAEDIPVERNRLVEVSDFDARVSESHRHIERDGLDRKSTRLNSSHSQISYAVFCLKKKNDKMTATANNRRAACCPISPEASA